MTVMTSAEWEHKRGSVGRAVVGVAHICDDTGAERAPGQVGSVYFERDALPFVYHNDPEKTAEATHPDTKTGRLSAISDTSTTTVICS